MKEADQIVQRGVVVPGSAVLKVERSKGYGSVPGLDDAELADPAELERQAIAEEWGPVLALPVKGKGTQMGSVVDESGGIDFGAFGTVDFEKEASEFDKALYKAEKLREQMRDLVIRMGIVKERLSGTAKYQVLKYLRMGVIGLEDVAVEDMRHLGGLYLRARRLRKEIRELEELSRRRVERRVEAWLVR